MVDIAQLARAPDCGSGGRRFETDYPPQKETAIFVRRLPFLFGSFHFSSFVPSFSLDCRFRIKDTREYIKKR